MEIKFTAKDFKPLIDQTIRDVLISDIGELWDDYCYRNNIPPNLKLEVIDFLEDFSNQLVKEQK
jgi:hypothetical protein